MVPNKQFVLIVKKSDTNVDRINRKCLFHNFLVY